METFLFYVNDQETCIELKSDTYHEIDTNCLNKKITIEKSFVLQIIYPLRHAYERLIVVPQPTQVTLQQLLELIDTQYTHMYAIETRTNLSQSVEMKCMYCGPNLTLYDTLFNYTLFDIETCVICLSARKSAKIILNCTHKYHYTCLKNWFTRQNACPLCKTPIVKCAHCHSTRWTSIWNMLSPNLREPSTGLYGIGSVHRENIKLHGIQYDRETNTIRPLAVIDNSVIYYDV